jgi:hypothetical protein
MADRQAERRKAGLILIGAAVLTVAFALTIVTGILDLGEEIRLPLAGLLVFIAVADVFLAWRFFLTPRA